MQYHHVSWTLVDALWWADSVQWFLDLIQFWYRNSCIEYHLASYVKVSWIKFNTKILTTIKSNELYIVTVKVQCLQQLVLNDTNTVDVEFLMHPTITICNSFRSVVIFGAVTKKECCARCTKKIYAVIYYLLFKLNVYYSAEHFKAPGTALVLRNSAKYNNISKRVATSDGWMHKN